MTKNREISVVIFFDKNKNIYLQNRRSISKHGEKYGYWGGGIESGETPQDALKRELKEELGIDHVAAKYFKSFELSFPKQDIDIKLFVHYALINFDPQKVKVFEGDGFYIASIDSMLSDKEIEKWDQTILGEFKVFMGWK